MADPDEAGDDPDGDEQREEPTDRGLSDAFPAGDSDPPGPLGEARRVGVDPATPAGGRVHRRDDDPLSVRRWIDPVLGVAVTAVGFIVLILGGATAESVAPILVDGVGSPVVALALLYPVVSVGYLVVGLGGADAYLRLRSLERGFAIEWPRGDAARWLAVAAGAAVVVVGGGALLDGVVAAPRVFRLEMYPDTYLTMSPLPLYAPDQYVASMSLATVVVAAVAAPSVAALVHGVLQNALRHSVPPRAAVVATALTFAVTASEDDPLGMGLLVVYGAVAAYAYERSGNLAVPMAAWATVSLLTLVVETLAIVTRLGLP